MNFWKETPDEVISLLAEGVEVAGDISFSRGLRVDGVVKGKIRSDATLVIGPMGRVEAEVWIRRISINGEFHGVVRASDRVEIHKDGRVYGDLYTPCLIIAAGALFEGKCNMSERDQPGGADKPGSGASATESREATVERVSKD